jgi:predicted dehydrogenase
MIHDLDIILKLVNSEVVDVRCKRVSILSNADDICNARLEFANGCVVNLTASRMSLKNMRKLRLFQSDAYVSIDFLEKESQIIRMFDADDGDEDVLETPKGPKKIQVDLPTPPEVNAIQLELAAFARCVEAGTEPEVTLEDGLNALKLAERILNA